MLTDIPLPMPSGDSRRDDGERPLRGVVVTLRPSDTGRLLLAFDDVKSPATSDRGRWVVENFYTHLSMDRVNAKDTSFSDDLLRDVGFALLARLSVDYMVAEPDDAASAEPGLGAR